MQFDDVLQEALRFALAAGADYAEARSEMSTSERIAARNGGLESLTTDNDAGWGIHAYAGGGWGFAATPDSDPQSVRETAEEAVRIARASGAYRSAPADLSTVPIERGSYETPTRVDPFSRPLRERVALATDCTTRILEAGERVKVATSTLTTRRLDTLYANTAGAHLAQRITEVGARIGGIAVADDGYAYRRSFGDLSRSGWEFVEGMDLRSRAESVGREAGELVVAPWAPSGRRPVVLGSDFMALLVHESCGHPTELDRVLGWEAAFAGTSFLMPEMRGSFRYGSPLVNLTADSLLPGGMGTFGWDDEGTPAQRSPLVRDGVFVGYLSHRGSAAALGDRSNGCGRATSWGRIPLVRMVNVSLEPGTGSLDDLIAGVDDGLYIETPSSWSLDDKRMNFHFAGELCREIKGGKLGELRKAASFQGRTPDFWGSVRGVAGAEEWRLWGLPHCAKGEPLQLCPVSHGASPVLVEGLNVSVQGRKS